MSRPPRPICEIDGANFASLDEFYDEISKKLIPNTEWGPNLNAFNDILRGGRNATERICPSVGGTPGFPGHSSDMPKPFVYSSYD